MSIKLMSAVWDMEGLPAHLKMVLLRLADHANEEGYCRPGEDLLAAKVEQTARTVRRNIDTLELMGIVERTGRRSHSERDKRTMQYQLWIPVADPVCVDWRSLAKRAGDAEKDPADDWYRQAGWFLHPDRSSTTGPDSAGEPDGHDTPNRSQTPQSDHTERSSTTGSPPTANRSSSAPKPVVQRAQTGHGRPVPIRNEPSGTTKNHHTARDSDATGEPPKLRTVTLARQWATLKNIPFEGSRRSLVPAVIEAFGALTRDGVTVDTELLDRAHRMGINHPNGWWIAAAARTSTPQPCDRCSNRRQLAVLLNGDVVSFALEDLIHDVGVDHPIPCPACVDEAAS